jgi:hypothetical protein
MNRRYHPGGVENGSESDLSQRIYPDLFRCLLGSGRPAQRLPLCPDVAGSGAEAMPWGDTGVAQRLADRPPGEAVGKGEGLSGDPGMEWV